MKGYGLLESIALSPCDESLPASLLQEAFEYRFSEAQITTERVFRDVVKSSGVPIPEVGEEKLRLVVDTSDDMMQQYKDGTIKLAMEKGHMVAQIKENGRYSSKLAVKEENYLDGPDSLAVQNALQLKAIQELTCSPETVPVKTLVSGMI